MLIYRISGLLAFCLGLTSAGAGCAVAGDDAPSLGGPPRATQGGGTVTGTLGGDWSDIHLSDSDVLGPGAEVLEGVYTNGLSAEALTRNALITNLRANRAMVMLPLATETYADDSTHEELLEHEWHLDPELLRYRLRHEDTREVMDYLVSCALAPSQSVSYTDTRTDKTYTFRGEIGICPHWNWQGVHQGPAGAKCRQLITACLLALVNPTGRSITLSLRGQAFPEHRPGLLSPGPSVRVRTANEDDAAIPSFGPCRTDSRGLSRNCGWTAEHIGTCSVGSTVTLGPGGEPLDKCDDGPSVALAQSDGDTVLRVCDGIHGCNAGSPAHVAQSEVRCSGRREPALRFECPSSGYFSVMSGPRLSRRASGAPGGAPARRTIASFSVSSDPPALQPAVYPAQEADIFGWREGAFYGNFWTEENPLHHKFTPEMNEVDEEGNLDPAPRSGAVVFRHAFACTGELWDDEIAYQKDRLCAGGDEDEDCVAHSVGACGDSYNITNCPPLHQCDLEDGGLVEGDGDFQDCAGDGGTWLHPITSFLNDPVAVVRRPLVPPPGPLTPGEPLKSPAPSLCP
ncbi:hypothetical protein [Sorangium sp. So ce406]|uniref:hypothetical protein n=1 Tax=Sorangium sp. So ce406 TaxID=3133311 RepID=UPI003F5B7B79